MARENTIKRYVPEGIYHIYNRGNNKQLIFFEEKDYWVFRRYTKKAIERMPEKITLKAFALLPNHFHLLVQQREERSISEFMRRLLCGYGRYVSKKYNRSGNLYSGIYKAILVPTKKDFQREQKYILANPIEAGYPEWKHVGTSL